jgi:sulfur-oxidizing protein SoxY
MIRKSGYRFFEKIMRKPKDRAGWQFEELPSGSRKARRTMRKSQASTRRRFLGLAGSAAAIGIVPVVSLRPAGATPETMAAAIRNVVGAATVQTGKVKLDVPPLVENGNTVPMTVSVASPMTPDDYVRSIHVFNEKNPQPNIGNFYLGPRAGRGQISTRIRLADSQIIVAIAQLSDGSFWSTSVDVIVTLAACTEEVT